MWLRKQWHQCWIMTSYLIYWDLCNCNITLKWWLLKSDTVTSWIWKGIKWAKINLTSVLQFASKSPRNHSEAISANAKKKSLFCCKSNWEGQLSVTQRIYHEYGCWTKQMTERLRWQDPSMIHSFDPELLSKIWLGFWNTVKESLWCFISGTM